MDERQGFSRATKLVFLLLALLPAWYMLREQFNGPDDTEAQSVTFTETVVRIIVGVIGFMAIILLVHGGKRGKISKDAKNGTPGQPATDSNWFACPSCGQRVQRTPEGKNAMTICPACDNPFELNPVAASAPDAGSEEDVNKWLAQLVEQRQRTRRN